MDNKLNLNSIISLSEKLYNKFNDPHDLCELINCNLNKMVSVLTENDDYTNEEKLMFISQLYDLRKKKNLKDIIEGALSFLDGNVKLDSLNSDWLADFFDKASKITTEDFKIIWSRILAEEANTPNSISKRLLHNLFLMNKRDAENFINLSRFCFFDKRSGEVHPMIYYREHPTAYENSKITYEILKELERFSLIECDFESGFVFSNDDSPTKKILIYSNHQITIRAAKIKAGNIKLTTDGRKLFNIIEKHNNNFIMDYTIEILKKYSYDVFVD